MTVTYVFKSLEQLAAHFDKMSSVAVLEANRARSKKQDELSRREAYCWSSAANIVRNTRIEEVPK